MAAAAAVPAPVASAVAAAFDWPPSTRLTYLMNGNYRGEVQGSATVEWIRVGLRYQVHLEAIVGATRHGGEIMGMGEELGQVREGFLADLLLVDGDPLANLSILEDQARLLAIMKNGTFHKQPPAPMITP